jgi:hypothetical protein
MNNLTVFRISLIITTAFNLLGIFFKIGHYPYGSLLLGMSASVSLGFIIPGLIDVFGKTKYKPHEKLMWTVGFIFLSWIAGILYWPEFKKGSVN